MNRSTRFWLSILLGCWILTGLAGCKSDERKQPADKMPRPVSVFLLQESDPASLERVAGSVASWKTEEISFEVAGRVQYVIEPGVDVQGHVYDARNELVSEGTPLARLDDTRYKLNVNSIKAQIETTRQQREAALIEVESVIPAQERAAKAEEGVSKAELDRRVALLQRNAIAREEYERALAYTRRITVDELHERYEKASIPLGRSGKLSEVANLVCFLASDRGGYIHGTVVNVSGGKTRA